MSDAPTAHDVERALTGNGYRASSETDLHDAITRVLTGAGMRPEREVSLTRRDRVDVLVGTVAVEVKTAGPLVDVLRQCQRYAHSPRVDSVVLATTVPSHTQAPDSIGGKPLTVVYLGGGWLG